MSCPGLWLKARILVAVKLGVVASWVHAGSCPRRFLRTRPLPDGAAIELLELSVEWSSMKLKVAAERGVR